MEKIFSFFKNNPVLIIALIIVILIMCKPRKKTKITEKFSSKKNKYKNKKTKKRNNKKKKNKKKKNVKDLSKKVSCEGHDKNNCDPDRCEFKLNTCFSKEYFTT